MKIYTKGGDTGFTALFDGTRVTKGEHPIIEALGTIDECSSHIGVALSLCKNPEIHSQLRLVQSVLQDICSNIGSKGKLGKISEKNVEFLEGKIDKMQEECDRLTKFVLPGCDNDLASYLHICRSVCRRCERRVCVEEVTISPVCVKFLNRLSDYLFMLSRAVIKEEKVKEHFYEENLPFRDD